MDAATKAKENDMDRRMMAWMTSGHEVIFERTTFRHKTHRKDFPADKTILRDGIPFVTVDGHVLKYGDIFPERGDLCLDLEGNLVSQDEFVRRYREFLSWFPFPESTDIDCEPVPAVEDYISETRDSFSESGGFVKIGYNAKKPAEVVQTQWYDSIKDEFVEMVKTQATTSEAIQYLLETLKNGDKKKA